MPHLGRDYIHISLFSMHHQEPSVLTSRVGLPGGTPVASSIKAEEKERNEEHLKTDHLLPNLKRHTISGGAVTISAQGAKFGLNLASTVILAHLLTPRDFGLVAMVTAVTGFLAVFRHAGLSIPTVQREHITDAQVSNLFWINLGVSGLCALIVAALSPAMAWFYRDSRITYITLALSTTFLIGGFRVQHLALLKRQMRFKAIALIEVGSMATGVLVGVVMALLGYGYWSLVGLSLAMEIAAFLLTGSVSRWRPKLPSRGSGIGPLLAFGAHQTAASFIFTLARGCDNILIGRVYGPGAVGLYSRGAALVLRPLEQFLLPIDAVFLPTLSLRQSQPERYRSTFLRLYEAIALTIFFFSSLLLALALPVTLVLLGRKWEQASAIFAGFTFMALQLPLSNAANWLLTSQGRGKDIFRASSIAAFLTLASFIAGLPFGPVGVAIAFSASGLLIRLPILYYIIGRRGPVTTCDLWMGFLRHLPLWVVMFVATWLMRAMVADLGPLTQLLICAPVGILVGAAFICIFGAQRRVAIHLFDALREIKAKTTTQK
jgi:O-antigen/teichoic acid export membrane protein